MVTKAGQFFRVAKSTRLRHRESAFLCGAGETVTRGSLRRPEGRSVRFGASPKDSVQTECFGAGELEGSVHGLCSCRSQMAKLVIRNLVRFIIV